MFLVDLVYQRDYRQEPKDRGKKKIFAVLLIFGKVYI